MRLQVYDKMNVDKIKYGGGKWIFANGVHSIGELMPKIESNMVA